MADSDAELGILAVAGSFALLKLGFCIVGSAPYDLLFSDIMVQELSVSYVTNTAPQDSSPCRHETDLSRLSVLSLLIFVTRLSYSDPFASQRSIVSTVLFIIFSPGPPCVDRSVSR